MNTQTSAPTLCPFGLPRTTSVLQFCFSFCFWFATLGFWNAHLGCHSYTSTLVHLAAWVWSMCDRCLTLGVRPIDRIRKGEEPGPARGQTHLEALEGHAMNRKDLSLMYSNVNLCTLSWATVVCLMFQANSGATPTTCLGGMVPPDRLSQAMLSPTATTISKGVPKVCHSLASGCKRRMKYYEIHRNTILCKFLLCLSLKPRQKPLSVHCFSRNGDVLPGLGSKVQVPEKLRTWWRSSPWVQISHNLGTAWHVTSFHL